MASASCGLCPAISIRWAVPLSEIAGTTGDDNELTRNTRWLCSASRRPATRLPPRWWSGPSNGPGKILSNIVLSQISEHAAFGGVVPEIAARAHVEALDLIVGEAMSEAGPQLRVARRHRGRGRAGTDRRRHHRAHHRQGDRPGGERPLVAVNHLEAHALTARLTDGIAFPYCLFLASGGHTQIVAVRGVGDYVRLGTTVDDAIGEAFDKTAKLLGLTYPGGPQVEQEALNGDPARFALPRPMGASSTPIFRCPA